MIPASSVIDVRASTRFSFSPARPTNKGAGSPPTIVVVRNAPQVKPEAAGAQDAAQPVTQPVAQSVALPEADRAPPSQPASNAVPPPAEMATRVEEPTIETRQAPVEITDSQGEASSELSSELSSLSRSPSRGSSPENITSKSHGYPYEDKRPIPNTAVARHYPTLWVFGNKNDREPLVLKCPTCDTCIDEDPYKSDQATDHFKECRLPFENVQDLINRYATRVVAHAGRILRPEWAEKHNKRLASKNDRSRKRRQCRV
ncbi:hypothetical protein QBC33DRAFT_542422 [Phialemonium atrogriseum]|uniref:Uncharacterized protein n=1 Tax=Phialemonium atrogriseum TaxID=1093897 RepID=A0AAJ0BZH7_9PEZI|nr:uncharacterized protein QBC33DRAFT_542422 [Phialemonium atrogriseum]KAK1766293.1 hypothetical protein QBC33DRAFT_542422 [Phialemonium atrogriseum]